MRLKYDYSVISVMIKRLPGHTKNRLFLRSWLIRVQLFHPWAGKKKGKKPKLFLVLSPRPGPDGPNASGWYRRLHEPILPLLLLNCDQLWRLFSRRWTNLLSTIGILPKIDLIILPSRSKIDLVKLSDRFFRNSENENFSFFGFPEFCRIFEGLGTMFLLVCNPNFPKPCPVSL